MSAWYIATAILWLIGTIVLIIYTVRAVRSKGVDGTTLLEPGDVVTIHSPDGPICGVVTMVDGCVVQFREGE